MQTNTITSAILDRIIGSCALIAIKTYKRFLSPYKGFSCPHNSIHKNGSCSDFAISAIRAGGFRLGVDALKQRFLECKQARIQLYQNIHDYPESSTDRPSEDQNKRDRKEENHVCSPKFQTVACLSFLPCGAGTANTSLP